MTRSASTVDAVWHSVFDRLPRPGLADHHQGFVSPGGGEDLPGGRDLFLAELKKLGPMGSGQLGITMMFLSAAVSWIVVPVLFDDPWATEAVIALVAGVATVVIPAQPSKGVMLMNGETALKTPWGVLILCGGG